MRKIDWKAVKATQEGEYRKVAPGAYLGRVTDMRDVPDKEYVTLVYDIADGEYAGFYSDGFYADKEWAHSMTLSYKDAAMGMTKGRLETIQACNPGFDPFAAWDAERYDMFVGRAVGLVFRQEEYYDKKTGEFKVGPARCFRFCKRDEVAGFTDVPPKMLDHDGKVKALERAGFGKYEAEAEVDRLEELDGGRPASGASKAAAQDDEGVPF